ncbi:phosphatidate cytidylyltransferase [Waterburya agarophytonicola K14]|uniref:Phosphatidate cytidylyltransferase n=1 Tax=Waterburya agarophytonicola KI4 TaxID=2874699 RepID=A0A964BV74_9CYAN|nr:diacylglycerol/polyprenol kinase family protein [Waterburya agarophytonicola]MCC0179033.1 phosphatidate cytidylyltransferase [Waterburya agarophytonicola KI4]
MLLLLGDHPIFNFAYPLGAVFVYLGILVAIADFLSRLLPNDPELTRKVVHIGSGNVILLAWWFNISTQVIVSAAIIAAAIAIVSYIIPILPSIESVGRKSFGTLFYAISMAVLTACFWQDTPQYAAIGILIMAWGDGMAAIIGQRFGKHLYQIGTISKSWEGSLAMMGASFIVTELILLFVEGLSWQILLISSIVAVIATILEGFSQLGIDNLTVPLCSGIICFFCIQAL